MNRRTGPVLDRDGEPVTQDRWDQCQARLDHLERQLAGRRFLRMRDVEDRVGLRKSQIYKLIAAGEFPAGIKLTERAMGWLESEVDAFMRARVAQSRLRLIEGGAGASAGA